MKLSDRIHAGNLRELLGALVHGEDESDGIGTRNSLIARLYGSGLVSVFGQQLFKGNLGLLGLCGIRVAPDRQADTALHESVGDIRRGDGLDAVILNSTDDDGWNLLRLTLRSAPRHAAGHRQHGAKARRINPSARFHWSTLPPRNPKGRTTCDRS